MSYLHWSFFETIDEDLLAFSRQVEFAEDNFATYSVYLTRLYLTICSEVDVAAKVLCKGIDACSEPRDINQYKEIIVPKYPNFSQLKISIRPMSHEILPWKEWQNLADQDNPPWWRDHNKVKHARDQNFRSANLGNVLQSAAGLLVLLVYQHHEDLYEHRLKPNFRIFEIDRTMVATMSWGFSYKLPDFGDSDKLAAEKRKRS
jgi:hypothetical protein